MSSTKPTKNNKTLAWRARLRRAATYLADTPLPEILFISTFVLIRWWNNSDFSYPSEIVLPVISFGVLATIIFYIYRYMFGPGLAAHVGALSLSYLLYVFQFVEGARLGSWVYGILPGVLSGKFISSLILAGLLGLLCGGAAWILWRLVERFKFLKQLQLLKVILFAIAFIFALQLVRTGTRLFEVRHQLSYQHPPISIDNPSQQSPSVKPDIYYLVFDRYANSETLKNNFKFDNSDLLNFLDREGFVTRNEAFSNYAFTMSSVASTLAMDYFPQMERKFGRDGRWQSAGPYRSVLNDPPIASVLSKQGYTYNQVSSWWDFTRIGINADNHPTLSYRLRVLNKSFYLSDLQRDIFFKSFLSPLLKQGLTIGKNAIVKYDLDRNPVENFDAQFASLKAISSRPDKSSPEFTFAHVLAPHPPYIFDENGNIPSYDHESNDNGVDEKIKYLNELAYVNKRITDLIGFIRQQSPNAVIILQSDEGPYPKQFRGELTADRYYDPIELPQQHMRQKFGILASYYLPGVDEQEVESSIQSSVNVFRFVLNKYLGYNLTLLPNCQLASGNKFNIYNYTVVNDRLTGTPLPNECRQYE